MRRIHPCGGIGRRQFLASGAALPLLGALAPRAVAELQDNPAEAAAKALGVPGPYPGRVVEARNPAMIRNGVKNRQAIKATLVKALQNLTGADDGTQAWRGFFEPGDVVGIKVVPNGYPQAHTSYELVLEVIEGLKSAGVKTKDMVVFDRYKSEFMAAKYQDILPSGIAWGAETPGDDEGQLRQSWPSSEPLAGYDPDQFVEMNLIHAGADPKDERGRAGGPEPVTAQGRPAAGGRRSPRRGPRSALRAPGREADARRGLSRGGRQPQ